MLLNEGTIISLVSLTNGVSGGETYFPDIHRSFKITLLIAEKGELSDEFSASFKIDPRYVPKPNQLLEFLANSDNFMEIKVSALKRFSPDSLSMMEFRNKKDYYVAGKIYEDWPLMGEEIRETWSLKLGAEFHMTNARSLFNQNGIGLPLYEGKMIHQFDSYFAEPRFWIEEKKGRSNLLRRERDKNQVLGYQQYRLAYRDIARSTDQRTIIATILPQNSFAGNTLILETNTQDSVMLFILALMNSFILDHIVRYKVGTHVSMFYAYQLPMPRLTAGNPYFDAIVPRAAQLTCTTAAFAPLWEEVMGTPWIDPQVPGTLEVPGTSMPTTDPSQRQQLRNELDAIIARLYGLNRQEFAHILDTFPLVFPNTPEGQTKKEALLALFDHI
ncbi:MAG: hypothetical protein GY796_10970 [Chloroflexi bacterium]|nr:hypothetical protein [Chloroflexota bacterium]